MGIQIESLEWDSNFFGFNIGIAKIDASKKADIIELSEIIKSKKIKLIYVVMPDWNSEINEQLLKSGAKFVDKKTTYSKLLNNQPKKFTSLFPVVEFQKEYFSDDLISLAHDSGKYSRFLLDKGFGEKSFKKLYDEWLYQSVSGKLADKVWVVLDNKKIIGFVTAKKNVTNEAGQIGLIAVSENYQGKKVGHSLMSICDEWYLNNNLKRANVVTQGANITACKFYEAYDYKVEKIEYYYHLWV